MRLVAAIVVAGLLVGAGLAIAGLSQRFAVEPAYKGTIWRIDRLTGEVVACRMREPEVAIDIMLSEPPAVVCGPMRAALNP